MINIYMGHTVVALLLLILFGASDAATAREFPGPVISPGNFQVYRGNTVWAAKSPNESEVLISEPTGTSIDVFDVKTEDVPPNELFTNAKADWMRILTTSEIGKTSMGTSSILRSDSVITFVANGIRVGTQILRIDVKGNVLYANPMIPDPGDTVFRFYYTTGDARLLDNGDIQLAGWSTGWQPNYVRRIGAITPALLTKDNHLNIRPVRFYTKSNPLEPTDINPIAPHFGVFGNKDTAFFLVGDQDWSTRLMRRLFGRFPGRHPLDTALIVEVPRNRVDSFIAEKDVVRDWGGTAFFSGFDGGPATWTTYQKTNGDVFARVTFYNSDLLVTDDCIVDSITLFQSIPVGEDALHAIYWDHNKKAVARRVLERGCVTGPREVLYPSQISISIDAAFYRENGNLVVCGIAFADDSGSNNQGQTSERGFAMEISTSGTLVWRYQIGRTGSYARINNLIELPDGSFVMEGYYNFNTAFITRIRPDATMSSTDDASEAKDARVVLSPNPLGPGEDLSLRLPESGVFDLELMDMSGRVAHRLPSLRFEAHTSQGIPCPELSAGSYMLVARSQARYFATRLVKY